jgi:hypothetical protein
MPEILTKYPDVALTVLKSGGGKCGVGMKQQILTSCPPEDFCSFPQGEICVYGLDKINAMTQINVAEIHELTSTVPTIYSDINIVLLMVSCLAGIFLGMWLKRK